MLRTIALGATLAAAAVSQHPIQNLSQYVTVTWDADAGARACGAPCVPLIATIFDVGLLPNWVTIHPSVWLPCTDDRLGERAFVLFFSLPSPFPLSIPGMCGDVLLSPDVIVSSPQWLSATGIWYPYGGWQLDITGAPHGASVWLQILSIQHGCNIFPLYGCTGNVVLDSVSDRYLFTRL